VETLAGGAELNVVTFEVDNLGATEDSEVLELSLSNGRAVVSDDHELGGAVAELLLGELVANLELAGADSELELLLDVFRNLGLLSHIDA